MPIVDAGPLKCCTPWAKLTKTKASAQTTAMVRQSTGAAIHSLSPRNARSVIGRCLGEQYNIEDRFGPRWMDNLILGADEAVKDVCACRAPYLGRTQARRPPVAGVQPCLPFAAAQFRQACNPEDKDGRKRATQPIFTDSAAGECRETQIRMSQAC